MSACILDGIDVGVNQAEVLVQIFISLKLLS